MLELRGLRHLVVLAKHLSYVRAADELGLTQPSLTRSIQAVERKLGIRLFDRDRGGSVELTSQGRFIAERAAFLLTDAEDLERHSALSARGESGRICFGMAPLPARALLQSVLADRVNSAPRVINEVAVRDVEALWSMLTAGDIEFFVAPNAPLHDLSMVRVEKLGTFPLSMIVRAGHPLLEGAAATDKFPLLRSSWTGIPVPAQIRQRILGPPNVVEDFATLAGVTSSTNAIWLSSTYAIEQELQAGSLVEFLRVKPPIEIVLYALSRRSPSPLAKFVSNALREHVKRLQSRGM